MKCFLATLALVTLAACMVPEPARPIAATPAPALPSFEERGTPQEPLDSTPIGPVESVGAAASE